jgi:malic enzyme
VLPFSKNLIERAVRAFIAGATASVAASIASTDISLTGGKALIVGAGAAGVSAVMTLLSQLFGDPKSGSFLS